MHLAVTMPRTRRPNPVSDCPLTAALAAMGGKWKLIIIYWLAESPRQFLALRRLMPSISPKVLTEQLQELIADGIVSQRRTGRVPAPVVYSLTEYGRSLLPIAESVRLWGRRHIERFASEPVSQADASSGMESTRDGAAGTASDHRGPARSGG
jgi:DNA-binding HxlR family transcriptional regulator